MAINNEKGLKILVGLVFLFYITSQ